jgi:dTDP-glucose 4,6-dehydratase
LEGAIVIISLLDKAGKETIKWYQENQQWWKDVKSGDYKDYYKNQYQQ